MSGVYGFQRSDPVSVNKLLVESKEIESHWELSIEAPSKKTKVLFIFSLKALRRIHKDIKDKPITVFVFGSKAEFERYTVKFLDDAEDFSLTKKLLKDCLRSSAPNELVHTPVNISRGLLEGTTPSILQGVFTYFYRIPDKEERDEHRRTFVKAACRARKVSKLEPMLISLSVPDNVVAGLMSSVDRKTLDKTLRAIYAVRKKRTEVVEAAEKYGVSPFDIRYLLAQREK